LARSADKGGFIAIGLLSTTPTADRYAWSRLNRQQLGKYAEYLAKMEFLLHGCDVYTSEVDDHGIDFVIRTRTGRHYDVQVKSYRLVQGKTNPYIFLPKSKFEISPQSLLVLVQFREQEPASLFMIPSCVNGEYNPVFESRDYGEGRKSKPEWGISLTAEKRKALTQNCLFSARVIELLYP
jgi:hypothetical protein